LNEARAEDVSLVHGLCYMKSMKIDVSNRNKNSGDAYRWNGGQQAMFKDL
jgi:hypothetical protein